MGNTFYVGLPGALAVLTSPLVGAPVGRERQVTVLPTLGGGRSVDRGPSGRRQWRFNWIVLDHDTASVLEEFYSGARGRGPFTLIDPFRRNQLTVNQSSATSERADTTGFSIVSGSGETLTSQSGVYNRGPYALKWSLPSASAPSSGLLTLDPPSGLTGFPVPSGEPWTFSAQLRGGGADPALSVAAQLVWLRADGSLLTTTAGTAVSTAADAWTQVSVSASAPPSGAVYLSPRLQVDLTSVMATASGRGGFPLRQGMANAWGLDRQTRQANASSPLTGALVDYVFGSTVDVYVDQVQLDMFASTRAWVLGTGMPRVTWTELPDTYPFADAHDVSATLLEVG